METLKYIFQSIFISLNLFSYLQLLKLLCFIIYHTNTHKHTRTKRRYRCDVTQILRKIYLRTYIPIYIQVCTYHTYFENVKKAQSTMNIVSRQVLCSVFSVGIVCTYVCIKPILNFQHVVCLGCVILRLKRHKKRYSLYVRK